MVCQDPHFRKKKIPLQTVLFISDQCNLRCKHCCVYAQKSITKKSYEQIKEELQYAYGLGSRFVDFEGGEPTLWRDGEHDLNSLIRLAKEIGFFSTTVTTNAVMPFHGLEADSIWVSMDGVGPYHDRVRGEGVFDRLVRNIETCGHPHLSVNMVVSKLNYESLDDAIEFARTNPHIRSISINFLTTLPRHGKPPVGLGHAPGVDRQGHRVQEAGLPHHELRFRTETHEDQPI